MNSSKQLSFFRILVVAAMFFVSFYKIIPILVKNTEGLWQLTTIAEELQFAEGPLYIEGDGLYFSDIIADKIWLYNTRGELIEFISPSSKANGLTADSEGNILVAQHESRQLGIVRNDSVSTLVGSYLGRKLNSPNDITVSDKGQIYFTDPPFGIEEKQAELDFSGIYKLELGQTLHLLDSSLNRPNGIVISKDQSSLFVSDTESRKVFRWKIKEDKLIEKEVFVDLSSTEYLDGMTFDMAGRLFVTSSSGVHIIDTDGQLIDLINVPGHPTNCTWVESQKTLFITTANVVYSAKQNGSSPMIWY